MSTFWLFCKMKISKSSRMTAKQPTATQIPLILVRFSVCWAGAGGAGGWGGACGVVSGAGWPAGVSAVGVVGVVGVWVGCGSVVIGRAPSHLARLCLLSLPGRRD